MKVKPRPSYFKPNHTPYPHDSHVSPLPTLAPYIVKHNQINHARPKPNSCDSVLTLLCRVFPPPENMRLCTINEQQKKLIELLQTENEAKDVRKGSKAPFNVPKKIRAKKNNGTIRGGAPVVECLFCPAMKQQLAEMSWRLRNAEMAVTRLELEGGNSENELVLLHKVLSILSPALSCTAPCCGTRCRLPAFGSAVCLQSANIVRQISSHFRMCGRNFPG